MKGLLIVLFVGSVSCIPYGHGGYNKFSKYFMKDNQRPLSFSYMANPMAQVDISNLQPSTYHHSNDNNKWKMVGEQFFKHEGGHHGSGHHNDDDHKDEDSEELPYSVVEDYGPYELREYPSVKFACVKSEVDNAEDPMAGLKNVNPFTIMSSKRWRKSPNSIMFKQLFKYISGVNKEGQEVEMTRPVSTHHKVIKEADAGDLEVQEMCFYVPMEHQASPPQPLDTSPVYIHTRPRMRVYAMKFGGHMMSSDDWVEKREVLEYMILGKAHPKDEYYTNGYNSPFTFYNRRNEIWVQDTTFVASADHEAAAVEVRGDEEAVAEPEHVLPEEDLSVDVEAEKAE